MRRYSVREQLAPRSRSSSTRACLHEFDNCTKRLFRRFQKSAMNSDF
jgi:hypothetical protein